MCVTRYSVALICKGGHIATPNLSTDQGAADEYCSECGEKKIFRCPSCNASIRGIKLPGIRGDGGPFDAVLVGRLQASYSPPSYCYKCGKPFPWTESKITAAIELFLEFGDLNETQKETIEQDIANLTKDAPATELSAMRIKRIWESTPVAIAREGIMEFCSRTAAKILNGQ